MVEQLMAVLTRAKWPMATDFAAQANVGFRGARSTGQCNTACSLSAGVWKPKVFRGR
jgi:hypothetical protein